MEQSIGLCYRALSALVAGDELLDDVDLSLKEGSKKAPAKGKKKSKWANDPDLKKILKIIEDQRAARDGKFPPHPKLNTTLGILLDHFNEDVEGMGGSGVPVNSTRAMVFANLRGSVDEIVELLNEHQPVLRAARFVGQSNDTQGKKGITQKDQLEVCFRSCFAFESLLTLDGSLLSVSNAANSTSWSPLQ